MKDSGLLDDNARIIEGFKQKRKIQLILLIPFAVIVILFFLITRSDVDNIGGLSSDVLLPPIVILMVLGLIFSFFNWRCPACKSYLGKQINPKHCHNCGAKLQ